MDHPVARATNLVFNAGLAAAVPYFRFDKSILGGAESYEDLPVGFECERDLLRRGRGVAIETIARALFPLSKTPWFAEPSGPIPSDRRFPHEKPDESWFFINGICADRQMAALNVRELENLFERPITLLYNSTFGVALDLYECTAGKGFKSITDGIAPSLLTLVQHLCRNETKRVIVLSHSQGTILAAVFLKWLHELLSPRPAPASNTEKPSPERRLARRLAGNHETLPIPEVVREATEYGKRHLRFEHIEKLELYCFANCATSMGPLGAGKTAPLHHVPWIESYGNEYDAVARLGILAPPHGIGSARIEGDRYRREETWGHLLNVHYLAPVRHELEGTRVVPKLTAFAENLRQRPRLFDYYRGRTPAPYP